MTCQPIAISVEKVISAWLDVMLPVSICTRGEVLHHLARLSVTAEWTTGMTGRSERTACDLWISQHSPASCQRAADVSIFILPCQNWFFSSSASKTTRRQNAHCCFHLSRHCKIKSAQEKRENLFIMLDKKIYRRYFTAPQGFISIYLFLFSLETQRRTGMCEKSPVSTQTDRLELTSSPRTALITLLILWFANRCLFLLLEINKMLISALKLVFLNDW